MKRLSFPDLPFSCPREVSETGKVGAGQFVREWVLTRPAFRARGNAQLVLEINAWLETQPGTPGNLSDEAFELLEREAGFPESVLRPGLVVLVAQIQQWLGTRIDAQPEAPPAPRELRRKP